MEILHWKQVGDFVICVQAGNTMPGSDFTVPAWDVYCVQQSYPWGFPYSSHRQVIFQVEILFTNVARRGQEMRKQMIMRALKCHMLCTASFSYKTIMFV